MALTVLQNDSLTAYYGDLHFRRDYPGADYDSVWSPNMKERVLYNVTACLESTVLFCAREG